MIYQFKLENMDKMKSLILRNKVTIGALALVIIFGFGYYILAAAPTHTQIGEDIIIKGKLGVGTASPERKLHVDGDVRWTGSLLSGSVPAGRISAGTLTAGIGAATPTASGHIATKGYVDAQSGGASPCPSEIESSDRSGLMLSYAIMTCRNKGGDWRLPTAEELACFIGIPSATNNILWTRSPYYGQDLYGASGWWTGMRLDGGYLWGYAYSHSVPFRCVR